MKFEKEPKYYYHITNKRWGHEVTLSPKTTGQNRPDEEPDVARTCVGPHIWGCLSALCASLAHDNVSSLDKSFAQTYVGSVPGKYIYIYRTKHKIIAAKPYDVCDAGITHEKWLLRPIKFQFYGTIFFKDLPDILTVVSAGSLDDISEQKRAIRILKNKLPDIKIYKKIPYTKGKLK